MTRAVRAIRWTVYSREGCGLCEELIEALAQLLGPEEAARIRVVDIASDRALERKYALRIPVLTADEEFVCAYRLDFERVRAYLDAESPG